MWGGVRFGVLIRYFVYLFVSFGFVLSAWEGSFPWLAGLSKYSDSGRLSDVCISIFVTFCGLLFDYDIYYNTIHEDLEIGSMERTN